MKRWKKCLAVLLCGILLTGQAAAAAPALITDESDGQTAAELLREETPAWVAADTVPADGTALEIGGKSAVLMELSSGKVLFEKNSHEKLAIASVTKIMTLLLVMEALDEELIKIDEPVTCSATAASMGGSQIWLEQGEAMTVNELLKAAVIVSANDACAALAEHISGSIEGFVESMNTRAAELGMQDTLFLDCSGLSDDAYSSAHDVALMSRELMKHEKIKEYTTVWMDTLRGGKSQLVNTNKLVRHYSGATGLKTGTTAKAGHCLSATAEKNGMGLCAVILGCATTDERFGGARKMLDYGFANYAVYTPEVDASSLIPVRVLRGVEKEVAPTADAPQPQLIKKGQEKNMVCETELSENLEAPVLKGQVIGRIVMKLDGEEVASYAIRAAEDVERMTFGRAFFTLLSALLG